VRCGAIPHVLQINSKQTTMKKSKQPSAYQTNVLAVNAELKKVQKSLGGCRSVLLQNAKEIGLNAVQKKLLTASKKPENYKVLLQYVRTSKAGNHSPFYLLQALHKHEAALQDAFAANATKIKPVVKKAKAA
jgi:hypothetical protein